MPLALRESPATTRRQATLALSFLDALGHRGGFLELRLRPEAAGAKVQRRFLANEDTAWRRLMVVDVLDSNAATATALMFGVNPRYREGGTDADVSAVAAIVVDLDGKGLPLAEQRARVALVARLVAPVAIVASGTAGHQHVYWRLDPACTPDMARTLAKRLRVWLGADATEPPSRMMRLPGSMNWKTGAPQLIRFLNLAPTHRTTAVRMARALDTLGVPLLPREPHRLPAPKPAPLVATRPLTTFRVRQLLNRLPTRLRGLVTRGWSPATGYPSRSEADMAVVRGLVEAGATDGEIFGLFAELSVGAKSRESSPGYLAHTIATARATTSPTGAVSHVAVENADANALRPGDRAVFGLRVLDGPEAGRRFAHGVTLRSGIWAHLWRSAGLDVPGFGRELYVGDLRGKTLRSRIQRVMWNGAERLEVTAFLPPEETPDE